MSDGYIDAAYGEEPEERGSFFIFIFIFRMFTIAGGSDARASSYLLVLLASGQQPYKCTGKCVTWIA